MLEGGPGSGSRPLLRGEKFHCIKDLVFHMCMPQFSDTEQEDRAEMTSLVPQRHRPSMPTPWTRSLHDFIYAVQILALGVTADLVPRWIRPHRLILQSRLTAYW